MTPMRACKLGALVCSLACLGARTVVAQTPFVVTRLTVSPDGARLASSVTDIGGTRWTADGL
jgi:hypothetical protein